MGSEAFDESRWRPSGRCLARRRIAYKPIADAAHSLDVLDPVGVDLLAKVGEVHVDHVGVADPVRSPHVFQDRLS